MTRNNATGWTDTHAHLADAQFDADRDETLRRARKNGIGTIVEIADSPAGWEKARDLAHRAPEDAPRMFWTCGFHPHCAEESASFDFDRMKAAAADPLCVAIGEIGLDYFKSEAPKEIQISLFRRALELADEAGKPVVIHCRDAQADTLRILKSFYGGTARRDLSIGVIHCFSGDASFAEGCLDLGFFLGVDGPLTYPSAKGLREVIAGVPLDKVVLETDCPYLPPQDFRGKRNESSYLPLIGNRLADLFLTNVKEVIAATSANAQRLYRLNRYPL